MLVPDQLKQLLASTWLVPEGGSFPGSAFESGDRFAGAVSAWFATATAGAFPVTTATARRSQLTASAAAAFSVQSSATAAQLLSLGVALYMAGQLFGAGVANVPLAVSAAQGIFSAVFTDTQGSIDHKAAQVALACHALALSTIVVFPPPLVPLPVS